MTERPPTGEVRGGAKGANGPRTATGADGAISSSAAVLRLAEPMLHLRPMLVVSDFDGTLSPIVQDPWSAAIVPLARRALRRLAAMPEVHVVVLSGRTAADVASRVRTGGTTYVGNHGVERGRLERRQRAASMRVAIAESGERFAQMAEELARRVPELVPEPWLVVERKAPAVSFHYRTAPDVAAAAARIREAVDALDRDAILVRFPGRRVLELRPPGAAEKGDAMRALLAEHSPAVAFALGDDVSDALAFRVLRDARSTSDLRGLAVAVQAHAEAPSVVAETADVLLASPREAAVFLAGLARVVAGSPGA